MVGGLESAGGQYCVKCFGAFEVDLGVARLEKLPTRRAQSLLLYLAVDPGKKFTRSQILADLWPLELEASARQGLRQALYLIRRTVEDLGAPSAVWSDRDHVWLDAESWTSDWTEFKQGRLCLGEESQFAPWNADDWCESFRERLRETRESAQESVASALQEQPPTRSVPVVSVRRKWGTWFIAMGALVAVASAIQVQRPVPDDPTAWSIALEKAANLPRDRQAHLVSQFADVAFKHNYRAHEDDWLAVFDKHLPLIEGSFAWAAEHDRRTAAELAGSFWRFCHLSNRRDLGRQWLSRVDYSSPGIEAALARAQCSWAFQLAMDGDSRAVTAAQQARERYMRLGDKWGAAHATRAIGFAYGCSLSTLREALATYKEAKRLFSQIGDTAGVATTDVCIAAMGSANETNQTQIDERIQAAADAFDGFSTVGNRWGRGFAIDRGWSNIALRRCEPSPAKLRRLGDSLREYADEAWQKGEPLVGAIWMARSLQIDLMVGDSEAAVKDCQWLGRVQSNAIVALGKPAYQVVCTYAAHAEPKTWQELRSLKFDP